MDIHSKRLDAVQQARRKKAEEAQRAAEEERRLCQELTDRIKAGETTGDRIMDYAFAQWGGDEHVVEALNKLETELAGKTGQPILAVIREEEWITTGRGGGFGPSGYEELRRLDIRYGILTDDKLVLDLTDGAFGFNTGPHAMRSMRYAPELAPSDIRFDKHDLLTIEAVSRHLGRHATMHLTIGKAAVEEKLENWVFVEFDLNLAGLRDMALLFQNPEGMLPALQADYREAVAKFKTRLEAAETELTTNRAKLFDDSKPADAKSAAAVKKAISELKLLQEEAAKLKLDPAPIADFLAKHAT